MLASSGLKYLDVSLFSQFLWHELCWHLSPPLTVKLNIISIPSSPEESLLRFSWLGTSFQQCHRKREGAIFTHAKLVPIFIFYFFLVREVWPSKFEPTQPGLTVSHMSQCSWGYCWSVKLWLLWWCWEKVCSVLKPETEFTNMNKPLTCVQS